MITTTKRTTTRRAATTTTTEPTTGRGVPRRALADGVVERRRTPRRRTEPVVAPAPGVAGPPEPGTSPELNAPVLTTLSASEHYQRELRRRADRVAGDLASLLAEAKAEYEAQINAPRPAGKGGRPKKKVAPADQIELSDEDALGPDED